MKRLLIIAVGMALAVSAVAFSPGPEVLALIVIALTVVLAVPWLNDFLSSTTYDNLTGHGHINLRAAGPGSGGRHGPRGIVVLVVMGIFWAMILSTWRQIGHAGKLLHSAGHALARTNTAARPLPS